MGFKFSTYSINELMCDEKVCWRHASVTAEKLCFQNVLPLGTINHKIQFKYIHGSRE